MLSDNRNILQLTALMVTHGIKDVVLCPGSRNAPIVHTFMQTKELTCHAITDERSAGFFALGLSLAKGIPAAVCVTSGSALVNLHPAVVEAYYQRVPLVVISADRPQAWIGQMDGQTMPQTDVFGTMSKRSVCLPEPNNEEQEWYANRLINEALLECTHRTTGPVHINLPISEPIYTFHTEQLPEVRKIERLEGLSPANCRTLASLLEQTDKRLIIIGQKTPDRQLHTPFLHEISKGFVSLCENLANLGEGNVALSDPEAVIAAIPKGEEERYRPELVITMGGHIISKSLKQFLRKYPPCQHWHVSPNGEVADTFCCLTHVIEAQPYDFLEALGMLMLKFDESTYTLPSTHGKGEGGIIGKLLEQLPEDAVLHLANSTAVREAQHYPIQNSVTVCCNRGINGIEGSLSTAVGYAAATPERPNFVVIGDLSFFYDSNALWNTSLPNNLHILLLNSRGGKIFDTLPVPEESKHIVNGTHSTNARHIAEAFGVKYMEGAEKLNEFINCATSVILETKL